MKSKKTEKEVVKIISIIKVDTQFYALKLFFFLVIKFLILFAVIGNMVTCQRAWQ